MSVIGKAHTRTLLYRTCFEWNAALGWYLATFIMVVFCGAVDLAPSTRPATRPFLMSSLCKRLHGFAPFFKWPIV